MSLSDDISRIVFAFDRGDSRQAAVRHLAQRAGELEDIVYDLAKVSEEMIINDDAQTICYEHEGDPAYCIFCRSETETRFKPQHTESCPWLRAKKVLDSLP